MCNGVERVRRQRVRRLAPVRAVLESHPAGERRRRAPLDVARLGRAASRRGRLADPRGRQPVDDRPRRRARSTCSNPANGAVRTTISVGPVAHFAAPAAALGLVLVPTLSGITAFAGPVGRSAARAERVRRAEERTRATGSPATDGNVFPFGGAPSCGSLVGVRSSRSRSSAWPAARTPGYWLVARDGGVFAFGAARFHGSMGGMHLNQPIVGMARDAVGQRLLAGRVRRRHLLVRRRARSTARRARCI